MELSRLFPQKASTELQRQSYTPIDRADSFYSQESTGASISSSSSAAAEAPTSSSGAESPTPHTQQPPRQNICESLFFGSILHSRKKLGYAGLTLSLLFIGLSLASLVRTASLARLRATLSRAAPFKTVQHAEPPSSLWGAVTKPYPTGAFWTNLVVRSGEGPVGLHPYGVKCLDSGVHVSYGASRRSVTQVAIIDTFASDWQIASLESYTTRGVERFDNGSVTMTYTTSAPAGSATGPGKYRAHLVKGSPYVTVAFDSATPVLSSSLMKITNVDVRIRNNVVGVQYIVTLGNYQKWLVYCSEPVVLIWKDNSLTSPVAIRGVIRVAILPAANAEQAFTTLMTYVQRYPVGMQTNFVYQTGLVPVDRSAIQCITFQTQGTGQLLMLALPHHMKTMIPGVYDTDESKAAAAALSPLYSIKGRLRAIVGDTWRMQLSLPSVSWNYQLSEKLGTAQLDQIAFQLMLEVKTIPPTAMDPYSFGKELARMARLALIADYLGIPEARMSAIQTLEASFVPWLTGVNSDALLYDRTWGGLVPTAGWADAQADYGAGWYSDHHFHYGYFVYGAAVLARLDAPFYDSYKAPLDAIVRDICNPDPTDPDFPLARHKDLFDGHSWASGLFQQANGKGQESSSEAANAYYACYLFALSTANKDLQWFSHALLALEVQTAQLYWHMPNEEIYDTPFTQSRMVGNVGAFDVTASTWFGSELEYVHGIQMMPITPLTAVLFDQAFAALQYPLLAFRLPPVSSPEKQQCAVNANCVALGLSSGLCCPTAEGLSLACCDADSSGARPMQDEWKSIIYIDHALIDREAARQQILSAGGFGTGNSRCNSLFWAASRPASAQPGGMQPSPDSQLTPRAPDFAHNIKTSCQQNSACDAAGLVGECCPTVATLTTPSQYLGCCPRLV